MLQSVSVPSLVQAAKGQYLAMACQFQSDQLLSGQELKANFALFGNDNTIPDAYSILYPAIPGIYDLNLLLGTEWQNVKAEIEIIDAKNFKIHLKYFMVADLNDWIGGDNSPLNSQIWNNGYGGYGTVYGSQKPLSVSVEVSGESAICETSHTANAFCTEDTLFFNHNDYKPGQDFEVELNYQGASVNHGIFVGFYRQDTIGNAGSFFEDLGLNYAKITNGKSQVMGFNDACILGGNGFVSQGPSNWMANVIISGSCLAEGGIYRMYVVYNVDGEWQSCRGFEITQSGASLDPIIPIIDTEIIDTFGNVFMHDCLNGIKTGQDLKICQSVNQTDFENQLSAIGLSGTYSQYFDSVGAIATQTLPLLDNGTIGGTGLNLVGECVTIDTSDYDGGTYIVFTWVFDYGTHKDRIRKAVWIGIDSKVTTIPVTILQDGNPINIICAENDGLIVVQFADLGNYIPSFPGTIVSYDNTSIVIDPSSLNEGEQYCIDIVKYGDECTGDVVTELNCLYVEGSGNPIGQEIDGAIWTIEYKIGNGSVIVDHGEFFQQERIKLACSEDEITVISFEWYGDGGDFARYEIDTETTVIPCEQDVCDDCDPVVNLHFSETVDGAGFADLTIEYLGDGLVSSEVTGMLSGGAINDQLPFTEAIPHGHDISIDISFTLENGCTYITAYSLDPEAGYAYSNNGNLPAANHGCEEDSECDNVASIDWSCDPETQTISVTFAETLNSGVVTNDELCSEDGINFIPCPATTVGVQKLYIRKHIVFDDDCEDVIVNDIAICQAEIICANQAGFESDITDNILTLSITNQNYNSPGSVEVIKVSLDGGLTFATYVSPIALSGGEDIIATASVTFSDGCSLSLPTITISNDIEGNCDYDTYDLDCSYDKVSETFSAEFTGNESLLTTNEKLYTILENATPNLPYSTPVQGEIFTIMWKLAYDGCDILTLVKSCRKPCNLPTDEDGCLHVCIDGLPIVEVTGSVAIDGCVEICDDPCDDFEAGDSSDISVC